LRRSPRMMTVSMWGVEKAVAGPSSRLGQMTRPDRMAVAGTASASGKMFRQVHDIEQRRRGAGLAGHRLPRCSTGGRKQARPGSYDLSM